MLVIYVSPHKQLIVTADGSHMTVHGMYVCEAESFRSLQDCEPFPDLVEVEIVVQGRFLSRKLSLTSDTKSTVVIFLQSHLAQQNMSFDCYAFVNLVKGIEPHKVTYMLKFWKTKPRPLRLSAGSAIFFVSGKNDFHHAAIYLGMGRCISVYGAGGDLEISSLKDMMRDFKAEHLLIAHAL